MGTTGPFTTTKPSQTGIGLQLQYDAGRAELVVEFLNSSAAPVKLDGNLIFGIEIEAQASDGSLVTWEERPRDAEATPLLQRLVDLPPGKVLRRVVTLREGFGYFQTARGAIRKGGVSVDMTTAYEGRRRLPVGGVAPKQITVRFDASSRMLRDGFTYCTGVTPESRGLELGSVDPVTVSGIAEKR